MGKDIVEINPKIYAIKSYYGYKNNSEGPYTLSYLLIDSEGIIVIDTGTKETYKKINELIRKVKPRNNRVLFIINTHAHCDHVGSNYALKKEYNSMIGVHWKGSKIIGNTSLLFNAFFGPYQDIFKIDNDVLKSFSKIIDKAISPNILLCESKNIEFIFNDFRFKIIDTPGHTKDSICILEKNSRILFSGDSICENGCFGGFPYYESYQEYKRSMEKLKNKKFKTILSGHFEAKEGLDANRLIDDSIIFSEKIESIILSFIKNRKKFNLIELAREVCQKLNKKLSIEALFTIQGHLKRLLAKGLFYNNLKILEYEKSFIFNKNK